MSKKSSKESSPDLESVHLEESKLTSSTDPKHSNNSSNSSTPLFRGKHPDMSHQELLDFNLASTTVTPQSRSRSLTSSSSPSLRSSQMHSSVFSPIFLPPAAHNATSVSTQQEYNATSQLTSLQILMEETVVKRSIYKASKSPEQKAQAAVAEIEYLFRETMDRRYDMELFATTTLPEINIWIRILDELFVSYALRPPTQFKIITIAVKGWEDQENALIRAAAEKKLGMPITEKEHHRTFKSTPKKSPPQSYPFNDLVQAELKQWTERHQEWLRINEPPPPPAKTCCLIL